MSSQIFWRLDGLQWISFTDFQPSWKSKNISSNSVLHFLVSLFATWYWTWIHLGFNLCLIWQIVYNLNATWTEIYMKTNIIRKWEYQECCFAHIWNGMFTFPMWHFWRWHFQEFMNIWSNTANISVFNRFQIEWLHVWISKKVQPWWHCILERCEIFHLFKKVLLEIFH